MQSATLHLFSGHPALLESLVFEHLIAALIQERIGDTAKPTVHPSPPLTPPTLCRSAPKPETDEARPFKRRRVDGHAYGAPAISVPTCPPAGHDARAALAQYLQYLDDYGKLLPTCSSDGALTLRRMSLMQQPRLRRHSVRSNRCGARSPSVPRSVSTSRDA